MATFRVIARPRAELRVCANPRCPAPSRWLGRCMACATYWRRTGSERPWTGDGRQCSPRVGRWGRTPQAPRPCSEPGCAARVHARGRCRQHYNAARRHPTVALIGRWCRGCGRALVQGQCAVCVTATEAAG